jgi:HAD superfamily hydrolase (TIGR01509 family)
MHIEAEAIFWDHDGLLVETEWLFYSLTRELFHHEGIELTQQLWSEEYLSKGRGTSLIAAGLGLSERQAKRIIDERNHRYQSMLEQQPPLCPFALAVLSELKPDFPMALVTGNSRKAIETVHRHTGVLELFDAIISAEDYQRAKPAPDAYLTAVERLSVSAGKSVAIEDSERGMAAALAAGMACIAVPGILTRHQRFQGAVTIQDSLKNLPSLITRVAG